MWSDEVMIISARDLVRFADGEKSLDEIWLLRAEGYLAKPFHGSGFLKQHPELLEEALRAAAKHGFGRPHLLQPLSEQKLRELVEQELSWLAERWREVLGFAERWREPLRLS